MAWNFFLMCTALRVLGSIMCLLVLAIVALSYHAIVIVAYGPQLMSGKLLPTLSALFILPVFHALLALLLWCYFTVVSSSPGHVPAGWKPRSEEDEMEEGQVKVGESFGVGERGDRIPLVARQEGRAPDGAGGFELQARGDSSEFNSERREGARGGGGDEGVLNRSPGYRLEQEEGRMSPAAAAAGAAARGSATVGADRGTVAREGREQGEQQRHEQSVERRFLPRGVRWCKRCSQFKPPRAHHCSVCGRCVLKMDHHCVWVVNCVGAQNYKAFLLFLMYTFVETLLVTLSLLPHFIFFFVNPKEEVGEGERGGEVQLGGSEKSGAEMASVFLAAVLNFAFCLSLAGFIAIHASLVAKNKTTIEAFEKPAQGQHWVYDLGRRKNVEQVFGTAPHLWPFPLYSAEDLASMPELQGLSYPLAA